MKIGIGFLQKSSYVNTSESTALKALGKCWTKLGNEVLYINRKITDTISPDVVDRTDSRLNNLDMLFELYDYRSAHKYMADARVKTGMFVWALSPLSKHYTRQLTDYRNPLFVVGKRSYREVTEMGIDAYLYTVGVDHEIFNPDNPTRCRKTTKFLWIGYGSAASGSDLVLRTYFEAFKSKDKVLLTIISHKDRIQRLVSQITADYLDRPSLNFVEGNKSPSEMAQIYKSHHALIMPLRFHGTCRPVTEAMACGTLVVAPEWTGPTDYASPGEALWINYTLEDAIASSKRLEAKYPGLDGISQYAKYGKGVRFKWAKPSVAHTAALMRRIHEGDYDLHIVEKALKKARSFSWLKIAKKILEVSSQI